MFCRVGKSVHFGIFTLCTWREVVPQGHSWGVISWSCACKLLTHAFILSTVKVGCHIYNKNLHCSPTYPIYVENFLSQMWKWGPWRLWTLWYELQYSTVQYNCNMGVEANYMVPVDLDLCSHDCCLISY